MHDGRKASGSWEPGWGMCKRGEWFRTLPNTKQKNNKEKILGKNLEEFLQEKILGIGSAKQAGVRFQGRSQASRKQPTRSISSRVLKSHTRSWGRTEQGIKVSSRLRENITMQKNNIPIKRNNCSNTDCLKCEIER